MNAPDITQLGVSGVTIGIMIGFWFKVVSPWIKRERDIHDETRHHLQDMLEKAINGLNSVGELAELHKTEKRTLDAIAYKLGVPPSGGSETDYVGENG